MLHHFKIELGSQFTVSTGGGVVFSNTWKLLTNQIATLTNQIVEIWDSYQPVDTCIRHELCFRFKDLPWTQIFSDSVEIDDSASLESEKICANGINFSYARYYLTL